MRQKEKSRGFATKRKERLIDRGQLNGDPMTLALGNRQGRSGVGLALRYGYCCVVRNVLR